SPSQRRLHRLGTHVVMPYTTHAAYSCSASAPYVITFTPSFLTYCTTSLCFTTTQQSHTHTHTHQHTRTHTYTLSFSLTHTPLHSPSHTHTHTHTLTLSFSHTHT